MNSRLTIPVAVAALLLAGCGSSSSGTSTPRRTATPASAGAHNLNDDKAQIKKAYVDFFSGKTGAKKKIGLVQHGDRFAAVIDKQAGGTMSKSTTATVGNVTVGSSDSASVTYTISLGGTPALKNQVGQAVREGGRWKVAAPTFCTLLKLEGDAPSICSAS